MRLNRVGSFQQAIEPFRAVVLHPFSGAPAGFASQDVEGPADAYTDAGRVRKDAQISIFPASRHAEGDQEGCASPAADIFTIPLFFVSRKESRMSPDDVQGPQLLLHIAAACSANARAPPKR